MNTTTLNFAQCGWEIRYFYNIILSFFLTHNTWNKYFGWLFANNIFKQLSLNKNVFILIKIVVRFPFPEVIDDKSALVKAMAWHWTVISWTNAGHGHVDSESNNAFMINKKWKLFQLGLKWLWKPFNMSYIQHIEVEQRIFASTA